MSALPISPSGEAAASSMDNFRINYHDEDVSMNPPDAAVPSNPPQQPNHQQPMSQAPMQQFPMPPAARPPISRLNLPIPPNPAAAYPANAAPAPSAPANAYPSFNFFAAPAPNQANAANAAPAEDQKSHRSRHSTASNTSFIEAKVVPNIVHKTKAPEPTDPALFAREYNPQFFSEIDIFKEIARFEEFCNGEVSFDTHSIRGRNTTRGTIDKQIEDAERKVAELQKIKAFYNDLLPFDNRVRQLLQQRADAKKGTHAREKTGMTINQRAAYINEHAEIEERINNGATSFTSGKRTATGNRQRG